MNKFHSRLLFAIIFLIIIVFLCMGFMLGQFISSLISNNAIHGTSVDKTVQQVWIALIVCLGIALIIILSLIVRITTTYTKPIDAATKAVKELAKGNYRARTYEDHISAAGLLGQSINIVARNIEEMTKSYEMQHDRLHTLIENMGSGLLFIDSKGYISIFNRTINEIFKIDDKEDLLGQLYYEAFTHKEMVKLVEEIFMTERKLRRQIHLTIGNEQKDFEVYATPILGANVEWRGVVLVFHDISDLKRLEQMRKDFVSNVSHELRTPITSIKGFAETLLDGAMNDKEVLEEFLSIILNESHRLQVLIQDLLDLSKMENKGFSLNLSRVNVKELLENSLRMLNSKAVEKDIHLELFVEDETMVIDGDVDRLKQVFINVINNSLSYSPNKAKVVVKATNLVDSVQIQIIDTGIGIEENELSRIFERFYRVDKARSRNSGGTGLGLAIVKHIIEAHEGAVQISSKVGEGTTVSIRLKKELTSTKIS
ncbi:two-component system histidine kinase PnpS [Bacillus sp. REN16]|uniref:two-component system histidine kinase PnpS n=1 Tax=Bacillus sp. REN16 TaxID=2887296 RepID=UPI001E507E4B|nr:HAMP domain-containing sensor histidine kinase [Bacillus sp. REN16]MCC3356459.1 PAS domain-containing protein [Bacillus sp. REN16]